MSNLEVENYEFTNLDIIVILAIIILMIFLICKIENYAERKYKFPYTTFLLALPFPVGWGLFGLYFIITLTTDRTFNICIGHIITTVLMYLAFFLGGAISYLRAGKYVPQKRHASAAGMLPVIIWMLLIWLFRPILEALGYM